MSNFQAWSLGEDEKIKDLVAKGNSFGVIGKIMGRSRNSVIGRAHRLNIKQPRKDLVKPQPTIVPPLKKMPERKTPTVVVDSFANGPTITELSPHQCRFSTGVNADDTFVFCAQETKPGSPYCQTHHSISYVTRRGNEAQS